MKSKSLFFSISSFKVVVSTGSFRHLHSAKSPFSRLSAPTISTSAWIFRLWSVPHYRLSSLNSIGDSPFNILFQRYCLHISSKTALMNSLKCGLIRLKTIFFAPFSISERLGATKRNQNLKRGSWIL